MIVKKVIVAGHICLDMVPDLSSVPEGQFQNLLQPGRMIQTGGATLRAGGAVPNTGLALHKLGVPVQMIGKIGDDLFGQTIREIIGREAPELVQDLIIDPSAPTSFTIILSAPGYDRTFLHSHGANDTFYASDLPRATLQKADLFHFGYPSVMRSIYRGDGGELVSILQRARREGLSVSLDFTLPDPTSPAGKVDWPLILDNSLPLVDIFVPSVEELTFLLQRETFDRMRTDRDTDFIDAVTPELLEELSDKVLAQGVKALMVKIGHRGLYLRTGSEGAWEKSGRGLSGLGEEWHDRELWAPAFNVEVCGTSGAGDAAIAGFLASLLQGTDPETALIMASTAGAVSVEGPDAVSGLTVWEGLLARVKQGWNQMPLELDATGWERNKINGLWEKE